VQSNRIEKYEDWEFGPKQFNWMQASNKKHMLSKYIVPKDLINILSYKTYNILNYFTF
jgi:hypothetical protein